MPSTHYTDLVGPPVSAAWLNEVDTAVYNTLPGVIAGTVPLALAAGSVQTTALADGSVTSQKLGAKAVSAGKLADGAAVTNIGVAGLTTLLYAPGSVTSEALAPTAVIDGIPAGGITTTKLADAAVTSAKLGSGAALANLGSGSITATQLASGSVTTAKFDASAKAPFAGAADTATSATSATSATTATTASNSLAISDGAVSTTAKLADAIVTPAKLTQPLTLVTAQASASGTSIEFTGIPSWATRITLTLSSVSTNGSNALLVRVGTSAQTYTTGYLGSVGTVSAASSATSSTAGLALDTGANLAAAATRHGTVTITKISSTLWVMTGLMALSNTPAVYMSACTITITGTLDRVRIATQPTDVFDGGSIGMIYE